MAARRRTPMVPFVAGPLRRVASDRRVRAALEALGAHTVADAADAAATGGDIVAVGLPALPGQLRAKRLKMRLHGGRDQVAAALCGGGWKGFEHPLPTIVRTCSWGGSRVAFDVGANTGFYSLLLALSGWRVHAFEPLPAVVKMMSSNLELNRVANRVLVVAEAAGNRPGESTLYLPPEGTVIETSASLDPEFKGEHGGTIRVRETRLDDHWEAAGRPPVGFVKVDAEGHEPSVLSGALGLIRRCQPAMALEVVSAPDEIDEIRRDLGYLDVRLSPDEAVVGDLVRVDDRNFNHLLVPPSLLERTRAAVTAVGLAVRVASDRLGRRPARAAPAGGRRAEDDRRRPVASLERAGPVTLLSPVVRCYDSRRGMEPPDVGPKGPLADSARVVSACANGTGVPPDAKAVLVNATVANTVGPGLLELYPADMEERPGWSTLNWTETGSIVANLAVVRCGPGAGVKAYVDGRADLVIDVVGFYPPPGGSADGEAPGAHQPLAL